MHFFEHIFFDPLRPPPPQKPKNEKYYKFLTFLENPEILVFFKIGVGRGSTLRLATSFVDYIC